MKKSINVIFLFFLICFSFFSCKQPNLYEENSGDSSSISSNDNNASKIVLVTFDSNGGTGEMSKQEFTVGSVAKLNKNLFIKEGYEFLKWNSEIDGSGVDFSDCANVKFDKNITLYAIWTRDESLYRHSIGEIYYSDGTSSYTYIDSKIPVGYIVSLNSDGTIKNILALSGSDSGIVFGPDARYKVHTTDDDGEANCLEISKLEKPDLTAINWCKNYEIGIDGFGKDSWYLPSINELLSVYNNYSFFVKSYNSLIENGYTGKLSGLTGNHWSSTLYVTTITSDENRNFYYVGLKSGSVYYTWANTELYVRPMYKFKYD